MKNSFPATLGLVAAFVWMNAAGPAGLHAQTDSANVPVPAAAPTATPLAPASSPLPANIPATSPLAQVVRLVQAGIDDNIVQAYITNSSGTFNLDSDRIIYLTDIGTPNNLVTLMMQKDQSLQQQFASSQTAPPPPPPAPAAPDPNAANATPDNSDASAQTPPDQAPVDDQTPPDENVDYFYNTLSPYGSWVNVDGYGQCWRPTVTVYNHNWQPYGERGHWISTDCGWYWQSDYAWNSTFHYGRWFRDPNLGWCWWPDRVWAPSWVTWRYADDYCGWAPLPPFTVYRPGVGFLYRGNGISVGFDFGLSADVFIFVPTGHFNDPNPHHFRCPPNEVVNIYGRSTVINNLNSGEQNGHHLVFNGGIPVEHFAGNGGAPIRTVHISQLSNPTVRHAYVGNYNNQFQQPVDRPGNAYQPPQHSQTYGHEAVNNNFERNVSSVPIERSALAPAPAPHFQTPPTYGEPHATYSPPVEPEHPFHAPAPEPPPTASSGENRGSGGEKDHDDKRHN